jgi:ABC-type glycerol-3-phosphate transport system permease component
MRRAWKTLKPFTVHLILLVGCIVFAFPFLWLVSTSAKRNEELAVFPPNWIPALPWYTEQAPFVDGRAYGGMKQPAAMDDDAWDALVPLIEDALWAQVRTHVPADRMAAIEAAADHAHFRPQAVAGLWQQVRELVPDRLWADAAAAPADAANPLIDFIGKSAGADLVQQVLDVVVRRLAVGGLLVRHLNNDTVEPASPGTWAAVGSATLAPARIESENALEVAYDLREADTFTLSRTLVLPVTADELQTLDLPVHCDGSWHRTDMVVETGGKVLRGERPFYMDTRTWQTAEYAFRQPPYRGSRAVVLVPDADAATEVTDPHTLRMTMTFHKSGRLRSAFDKYVDSYRWALRYIPFDQQLRNTIILVIMNVTGQLFACSLVAYGFARLKFYGRDVLFGVLLATMMLPGQVTMIPQFVLWKSLGLYNTLAPLWLPSWFGNPFFIFLLRQFFMTIPKELEDAAKIDGCGFFGIYWRIMLPLAGPALATVAIFSFMGAWNEFVGPLVYLSDERLFPLSLGLAQFRQENAAEWSWLMAASTLMMVPVIAVFFFCQRYFIQGVTLTGLKG